MKWHFRKQIPGDPTRDPIVGEFFATDAIDNPAEALVREGIQNSLDAGSGKSIHVRLLLAAGEQALSPDRSHFWFESAWPHFQAERNGLRDPPKTIDSCPFLVFEDFGTTGLVGDVNQAFDEPGIKNSFFYFFRAEGRSAKGETDRGRWGVGKHVFPRSSAVSSVCGLTIRADDGTRLLMGHTLLKSHCIGADHFTPDGYFGLRPEQLVLPIAESGTLDRFASDFKLERKLEPGLSLVVPYIDPEFTIDHLQSAVISGYFHPILKGLLTVTVGTPNNEILIDAKTLIDVALTIEPTFRTCKSDFLQFIQESFCDA